MRLSSCNNITDLRRLARRRLPAPLFHFLDGGADDEVTLRRNTAAFDDYELIPEALVDVSAVNMRSTLLGRRIEWPVMLSPTGGSRLFHHTGEVAVARAAARAGTIYSLSCMSTTSLEAVAAATPGPKVFQIYVFKDRGITEALVDRCRAAHYDALCLTVDAPLGGNRERDRVTGMTMPPRLSLKSWASFIGHPAWSWNALLRMHFSFANFEGLLANPTSRGMTPTQRVNELLDRSVTWKDAAWLAQRWGGPFIIKGILSTEDAKRAVDVGASAIMVSNHGGRQLDATSAPIDCIPAFRDAVGDRFELIVDGGVRRGTHVVTALALGANACSVGRPYLFGLAAAGEAGVDTALRLLRSELERDLMLMGCQSIRDLEARHVIQRPRAAPSRGRCGLRRLP